jgi:DNA-binding response OmpR family regulator
MQTVLLVEDSKLLRIAGERALKNAGYRVIIAGDGEDALRLADSGSPHVIILDMLLPKLSGEEVLRSLKKQALTAQIPVIVLSSLSKQNEDKLIREGAFAFLEKGSLLDDPDSLLRSIKQALTPKKASLSSS